MNIRIETERLEAERLFPFACLSMYTKGRVQPEEKCTIRTDFQRDRDRIIHSKAFRRLKHKTQVFIAPEGDHFRTRLTHTLEVAQLARTMGRALRLNEDLIEAISLAHDLGHTPFGHIGESILNNLNSKGFTHTNQSIRVVEFLESHENRKGLNLTYEVREGIASHSGDSVSETLEGRIIKFADRIAYINHDIDDAIRAGIISENSLPEDCIEVLGSSHGKRINTMISDIIETNYGKDQIEMSTEIGKMTNKLRDFMFENVYLNKSAKSEEEKAKHIITDLFNYYSTDRDRLPSDHLMLYLDEEADLEDIICDYIAGMTDRYIVNLYLDMFVPKSWK